MSPLWRRMEHLLEIDNLGTSKQKRVKVKEYNFQKLHCKVFLFHKSCLLERSDIIKVTILTPDRRIPM